MIDEEALKAAERQLEAMDRGTLAACDRKDRTTGLDYSCELTPEQETAPLFACVARAAASKGHGDLIPWLWDRYCDGQSVAEARLAIGAAVAKRSQETRDAQREADEQRAADRKPAAAVPVPRRVGADMASEREQKDWSDDGHWSEP